MQNTQASNPVTSPQAYPPPANQLLTLGDAREIPFDYTYLELGLGPEHIPDLIRMVNDHELQMADMESLEVWAPIHAWRALAQLHAEAAIEALLARFDLPEAEYGEWEMEELPDVYAMLGPAALPPLQRYLARASDNVWARITIGNCVEKIGTAHPESRSEASHILTQQLELFAENEPELNGFLISNLIALKAVEAAPVIEHAYEADCVDESIVGNWYDVQLALGLKTPEEIAGNRYRSMFPWVHSTPIVEKTSASSPTPLAPTKKHKGTSKKARRKMANRSRKQNKRRT